MEEEASEPHEAAFEAARADLEEQQLQLQETIKELKNNIMYVKEMVDVCWARRRRRARGGD